MGRALILANKEGGLYSAKPVYDFTRLDAEKAKLDTEQAQYDGLILKALDTLAKLADEVSVAGAALDAVIAQWQADLIEKEDDVPPELVPPDPIDPETGLPWTDPDRAQEPPVLDAINALRTGAGRSSLSRDDDLDRAALNYLRTQSWSGRMGHIGQNGDKPADRVQGVGVDAATVHEVLNYGSTTPASAVAAWQRSNLTELLDADATLAGIAYLYARQHPGTHLWCALIVEPGTPPPEVSYTDPPEDPAKDKAEDTDGSLERIKLDRIDALTPDKLKKVASNYAKSVQKEQAAQREVERLKAENLQRGQRIAELTALKAALEAQVMDVWCCLPIDNIAVGYEVNTAEIPGFWNETAISGYATIYEGTSREKQVFYQEQAAWNLVPVATLQPCKLFPAPAMSPSGVYWNIAMDPGHAKWKPLFRYGILTAISLTTNTCTVDMREESARLTEGESVPLVVDAGEVLSAVSINYPPCNAYAFDVGDEVLVMFLNFDRTTPQVIGFRRAPKDCYGRTSWNQVR